MGVRTRTSDRQAALAKALADTRPEGPAAVRLGGRPSLTLLGPGAACHVQRETVKAVGQSH